MGKQKLTINKQVDKSYQELYEDYLKVAKIRNLSHVPISIIIIIGFMRKLCVQRLTRSS